MNVWMVEVFEDDGDGWLPKLEHGSVSPFPSAAIFYSRREAREASKELHLTYHHAGWRVRKYVRAD